MQAMSRRYEFWKTPDELQNAADRMSGGCFTNVSRALQNNLAKIYNAKNHIYSENFKLKFCTCAQSMALGTHTKFQLEILIRGTIFAIHKFGENILESSLNVSETSPRYLTVVRPWSWKGSDLMCHHSVKLAISLNVGFLDSLHDPSAYVTPHDISDVAIPVHKHPLTAPPGFFLSPVSRVSTVWQDTVFSPLPSDSSGQSPVQWSTPGPGSVVDSSLGNQVPAKDIPQVVDGCFLWRTHTCRARHSMLAGMSAVSPKPMLTGTHISWSAILWEWRHPRILRQHHRRMRMAVSVMITSQDEGPTWAWICVAPNVPAGKLWRVAWCADQLLDHTPNDVTQKPQTCDVILSSMGEVRLWRGASYKCWNDDFWLETRAIFSTYRTPQILPNGIRTLGAMSHVGTLTSCVQLPLNSP